MKKQLNQRDLCVMYLAEHDGWYPAYKIKSVPFHDTFIGSEADTRLYEVFGKKVDPNGKLEEVEWEINGAKYRVQTMKHKGIRIYRAKQTAYKTIKRLVHDEVNHRAYFVEERV